VDVHTHYDGQATWDSYLEPSIYHGVTTVVMGNCGVGFAPADPSRHDWLIGLMEGVEDIPGTALAEGITWDWESFPEYLDALEKVPHSIDLAAQLPHGALRAYVMGERGADHTEVPSEDEIEQMRRLAREAVEAGAVGFTTSRTRNHKTVDGEPTPSLTSTPEELWGISDGLGDAGQGAFEIVCDFVDLESEFALIREMALRSGRPISLSLAQVNHKPDEWKRVFELIDEANAAGARMFAQVAPRPIGVVSNLDSSLHPFLLNKAYQSVAHLPLPERVVALRDPELRQQIVDDDARMVFALEHLYEVSEPPNYEPEASESIAARAERESTDAKLMALDVLLEDEGQGMLYCPVLNYARGNSDHSREMLLHPSALPGLGDGGAHVSFISDASFATYLLTHWARDRKRGEKLPLEFLVKRQTHDTAQLVGFEDRGVLAPGMKADVNVIDFEALNLLRPEMRYDLPAGGKRLVQRATGYRFTIVSGVVVMENDAPTGELPGRLLRGPQAAPVS
ncbi:MAG: amidohydrolase family protein, partial [Myxococcota bacterium]|nr:amidohydrolase family protein [Myxococcota bacterium]